MFYYIIFFLIYMQNISGHPKKLGNHTVKKSYNILSFLSRQIPVPDVCIINKNILLRFPKQISNSFYQKLFLLILLINVLITKGSFPILQNDYFTILDCLLFVWKIFLVTMAFTENCQKYKRK